MLRIPAAGTRLRIPAWLKEPDVAERGATAGAVAARFGLSRPAARPHLRLLTAAGLLHAGRGDGAPPRRRDEVRIAEVARMFEKGR